ncbi:hypothetical protein [Actinomadura rayongensis]|uniref:Uncharacterized protein n=1 Tax=Actinomadura rayongensis TaxID=1429076 RepID=A0A6I4WCC0_9ACTN|nr:hypothetical protein [Actinomadura rayongensis]MXQ67251.1 hypothetical protein [Actinomadura rayongensis]
MEFPEWRRTGDPRFPAAANIDGCWLVLRINGFPDHPLWTPFMDGVARPDLAETFPGEGRPLSAPPLDADLAEQVLANVRPFAVYGSENGEPCDDPVCCPVI